MRNITSITLIIISIGVFLFFIDPQYKNVKSLRDEIKKNEEIIDRANKLDLKKNELNDKYNQISPTDKSALETLLPDTVDNVRLIIDINNIAEKFGIVIRDISINSKDSKATD